MSRLKTIMQNMMAPCSTATKLASDAMDRPLTRGERISLRVHLDLCRWCRRYEKQLHVLHEIMHRHTESLAEQPAAQLSPAARERISQSLVSEK